MDPAGWGERGRHGGLPAHARRWLAKEIGLPDRRTPPAPLGELELPPSRLSGAARAALIDAAGAGGVLDDRNALLRHAAGKSYLDLSRVRRGEVSVPDAVVLPADHSAVLAVLRACAAHDVAVVPFGGGTSVVGGGG
jgi:alkyldihydroxyacetonephosphate synthase